MIVLQTRYQTINLHLYLFLSRYADNTISNHTLNTYDFILFFNIYIFYDAARIGFTFQLSLSHELNSLGHCICVHQGMISAAAGFEPGAPGSESTTLPMSCPSVTIWDTKSSSATENDEKQRQSSHHLPRILWISVLYEICPLHEAALVT